jgi:hypothetical protein
MAKKINLREEDVKELKDALRQLQTNLVRLGETL